MKEKRESNPHPRKKVAKKKMGRRSLTKPLLHWRTKITLKRIQIQKLTRQETTKIHKGQMKSNYNRMGTVNQMKKTSQLKWKRYKVMNGPLTQLWGESKAFYFSERGRKHQNNLLSRLICTSSSSNPCDSFVVFLLESKKDHGPVIYAMIKANAIRTIHLWESMHFHDGCTYL